MSQGEAKVERANRAGAWQSAGVTHRGKVRRLNEDAFILRPDIGLWGVADGMGGHRAGDVASRMIVEALAELPQTQSFAERLDGIDDAMELVNRALIEDEAGNGRGGLSGSTVAVLTIDDSGLGALLWAGDSRIYRYRHEHLEQLSTDHSQVEEYVREGLISRQEAATHPEANVITRALGSHPDEVLEADLYHIETGDRFLLCSDGLVRHVSDDEIARVLASRTPEQACEELLERALARGGTDNTTIVVVDILGLPGSAP